MPQAGRVHTPEDRNLHRYRLGQDARLSHAISSRLFGDEVLDRLIGN